MTGRGNSARNRGQEDSFFRKQARNVEHEPGATCDRPEIVSKKWGGRETEQWPPFAPKSFEKNGKESHESSVLSSFARGLKVEGNSQLVEC